MKFFRAVKLGIVNNTKFNDMLIPKESYTLKLKLLLLRLFDATCFLVIFYRFLTHVLFLFIIFLYTLLPKTAQLYMKDIFIKN